VFLLSCCALAVAVTHSGCGSSAGPARDVLLVRGARFQQLKAVRTWAYQIQALDLASRRRALEQSDYDLFVLEPTRTEKGSEDFDTRRMVSRLKNAGGRRPLVIAYVDIGEAENWRFYWTNSWKPPRGSQPGVPDFIIRPDPGGWGGCYPVAFWDPRWQAIIATGKQSVLKMVLDDGFDGIYMDWVEAFSDDLVIARAKKDGVDPARKMIAFIKTIRETAQRRDPGFLVIAQNACDLIEGHPEYLQVIDAIAQEDLHYSGAADVSWYSPRSGDIPTPLHGEWSTTWIQQRLDRYKKAGLPVFIIDYCVNEQHRLKAYRLSRARGYVPFVSRTPLDRLPPPPPAG
jgi:cysteinyl-tRNA synthetase